MGKANLRKDNFQMFRDRLHKKMTYGDLGTKYGISPERVRQKLDQMLRSTAMAERVRSARTKRTTLQEMAPDEIDAWFRTNFSLRTYNCLRDNKLTNIKKLMEITDTELLSLRNFGKRSLEELNEILSEEGIARQSGERKYFMIATGRMAEVIETIKRRFPELKITEIVNHDQERMLRGEPDV